MKLGLRWKFLIIFTILFTAVFVLFAITTYNQFFDTITELEVQKLMADSTNVIIAAASDIDGGDLRRLADFQDPTDLAFRDIASHFSSVQSDFDNLDVTLFLYSPLGGTDILYLYDTLDGGAELGETAHLARNDLRLLGFTEVARGDEIRIDAQGPYIRAVAPIYDPYDGAVVGAVGADISAARLVDVQERIGNAIVTTFAVAYPIMLIVVFVMTGTITAPLTRLTDAARSLESEEIEYDKSILARASKRRDEVGTLARIFDEMADEVQAREDRLKQQVAQLKIEIDRSQKEQQVEKIVDSDYFKEIAASASALRERAKSKQGTGPLEIDAKAAEDFRRDAGLDDAEAEEENGKDDSASKKDDRDDPQTKPM